jgi:hypothetical protein
MNPTQPGTEVLTRLLALVAETGQRLSVVGGQPRLLLWAALFALGVGLLLSAPRRLSLAERLARLDVDVRARQDADVRVASLLASGDRSGAWWLVRTLVGEVVGPMLLDAWRLLARLLAPVLPQLAGGLPLGDRLVLVYPGRRHEEAVWQHLGGKIIVALILGGVVPGSAAFAGLDVPLLAWPLGAAVGFVLPDLAVTWLLQQRAERVVEELPGVCQQLVLVLSAPQNLLQALHVLALEGEGVVAEELRGALARMDGGETLPEALAAMDSRNGIPELSALASMLSAADVQGTRVTELLDDHRRDLHASMRSHLLEASGRAVATMGLPVIVGSVPAVAVIVLVAVYSQLFGLYGT